jgi:hypothetical protein
VGNIIDTQGFEGLEFIISGLTITDGTYTPLIEDGNAADLSDVGTVAEQYLIGATLNGVSPVYTAEQDAAITVSNTAKSIGYVGKKRYVRLSLVSTNVSSGGFLQAVALEAYPKLAQYNTAQ